MSLPKKAIFYTRPKLVRLIPTVNLNVRFKAGILQRVQSASVKILISLCQRHSMVT